MSKKISISDKLQAMYGEPEARTQMRQELESIIDNLEEMRQLHFCVYLSPDFCDCKYGYDPAKEGQNQGEQTGCPEMREAIAKLKKLL